MLMIYYVDLCCRKTKAITAHIPNFVFVRHLFEETVWLCKMIESYQDLS